jgi:iron complex outermembrane recepter protein
MPAAVLMLTLFAIPLSAQDATGVVRGQVTAAGSDAPLRAVQVSVQGTTRGTLTDDAGAFRVTGLEAGSHELVFRRIGYATERRTVEVAAGEQVRLSVALGEGAVLVPEVIVSVAGEARRRMETAAAATAVSEEAIREIRPSHPSEVLNTVPGVLVSPTSGEGHFTAIRQPITTGPVYLFLEDGVPTRSTGFFNHNALYEVNVPQAERVEVIRGPGTALYGSDAIGGVIDVTTRRPAARALDATVEGSTLGWRRAMLAASDRFGEDGVRLDLNLTDADGWREGADYRRGSGTLRWDRPLGALGSLRTVATLSRIDQKDASSISREDFETRPEANYHPAAFRDVSAFRLATTFEREGAGSLISLTPFLRRNSMELLPSWQLAFDPVVTETGHGSAGLQARYRQDLEPLRARVVAGVDVDVSPGGRSERRIDPIREDGRVVDYATGDLVYDYDVTFRGISPYLQVEAAPLPGVNLSAGLRYDRLGYDYRTRLAPTQEGMHRRPDDTEVTFEHLSPKMGATWSPSRAFGAFASYRRGFRVPSEGQLFRQGTAESTVDLAPVKADSYEAGVRGALGARAAWELTAYTMEVRDDILSYTRPDGLRESVNAGRTRHRGLEAGLSLRPHQDLRVDLAQTFSRQVYLDWSPREGVDFGGMEMERAPRQHGTARLTWTPSAFEGALLGADWTRVGGYWTDPENQNRYEGHGLLGLRFELPLAGGVDLVGRATNLTDARYADYVSHHAFRGAEYRPGAPRTVHLGVRWGVGR